MAAAVPRPLECPSFAGSAPALHGQIFVVKPQHCCNFNLHNVHSRVALHLKFILLRSCKQAS